MILHSSGGALNCNLLHANKERESSSRVFPFTPRVAAVSFCLPIDFSYDAIWFFPSLTGGAKSDLRKSIMNFNEQSY